MVSEALARWGLTEASDASDVVLALVDVLGVPRSLIAVGIDRIWFDSLATNAIGDFLHTIQPGTRC